MRVAAFALFLIFSGITTYCNLFAGKKVMKEINRGNYLKALSYSKYCPDKEKELLVFNLIRNDFRAMYSNLEYLSEDELNLLIDYMRVLSVYPEVYFKIVERVRNLKSVKLTRKLKNCIEKPAWKSMLKQDLRSLKNAE